MVENSLSDCEELVMRCIWDSEDDIGVQQITQIVNERFGKAWKQQTVSTFLVRLVKKDFVEMYRKGRSFLYHPRVLRSEYLEKAVLEHVEIWNRGSVVDYICEFYKSPKLTNEDRQKIKDTINQY